MSCVFCHIVAGDIESSVVLETDRVLAFMDVHPATPGHVLVVLRAHLESLADLDDEVGAAMFSAARTIAAALRTASAAGTGPRCDGINLFYADGAVAFQEVFHAYLHVLPRSVGDGFTLDARWGTDPARVELDAEASVLRGMLG
jgi:histidine triad (HIT) family protein